MADDERRGSVFEPIRWAKSVPPMLRADGRPDSTAHHVLLVLATFADPDGSNARPSVATLARETYLADETVMDALKRIETAGLAVRAGKFNGTTVWRLNLGVRGGGADLAEQRREQARAKNAERQRRYRERQKAHRDGATENQLVGAA